ncbi:serine protease [Metabacillus indicus]|uniref:S1 family peptidase n=1 Tax=Metabacillus indicus TaxID=246786 RepID=UPI003181B6A2
MNIKSISTQLLYSTVPIWGEKKNGEQVSGTGFFFSFIKENNLTIPLLVTNYHVLKDVTRGIFEFVARENDMPTKNKVRIEFDNSIINRNKNETLDLIAIPIGPIINEMEQKGKSIFFRSITPDIVPSYEQITNLAAIEEITFIGYPSGIYDSYNVSPIVRRGITATPVWNDFKGDPSFLIDAGVYPGSSGSPVFLFNQGSYSTNEGISIGSRLMFLGVISESFVRSTSQESYLGLGKVINSRATLDYLKQFDYL